MFGSILFSLLNCELQRFILYNNTIKHLTIILSIFIFTFILNWYTPSSLVLSNKPINETYENINENKQYDYIIESILYTIFIYILFILSSKQEKTFMYIFIILLSIIIILYIIYLINIDYYKINQNDLKTFFIPKNKFNEILNSNKYNLNSSFIHKLFIIHNILSILYIILFICLLIGFYFYALKQQKEKKNNFNWITFIFGITKCRNVEM